MTWSVRWYMKRSFVIHAITGLSWSGSKSDRIDWRKLAELLRNGSLHPVYQQTSLRPLRELAYSYDALVGDSVRVMTRIKSLYRSRGILCRGSSPYRLEKRQEWLEKVKLPELRVRILRCYQQLDTLLELRKEAEQSLRQIYTDHHPFATLSSHGRMLAGCLRLPRSGFVQRPKPIC